MSEQKFDIIFRGDIVVGQSLVEVKQRMSALFKVDAARVDSLFVGGAVAIKRNLDDANAKHYQQMLQKIGVLVDIAPVGAAANNKSKATPKRQVAKAQQPADSTSESSNSSASSEGAGENNWQLAPVGAILGEGVHIAIPPVNVDTSHLSVRPQEGYLVDPSEQPSLPEVEIWVDDWDLAEVGADILPAGERLPVVEIEVDTQHLSLGEVGGDLLKPQERAPLPEVDVDTSHLTLVEVADASDATDEP